MRGKAVPQSVWRDLLVDLGCLGGHVENPGELACRQMIHWVLPFEQPGLRPRLVPIGPEQIPHDRGQQSITVSAPFALFDADGLPVAVNI